MINRPFLAGLALLVLALLGLADPAAAQRVVLEPGVQVHGTGVLAEVLARDNFILLDRDTTLAPDFETGGDLLVWDAQVRLDGSVAGTVVVVNSTFFVRPGARVAGRIVSLGGLVLPSGLAEIGEIIEVPPDYRVDARTEDGILRLLVRAPPAGPRLVLGGLFGVRHLAYDRVDGFSASWGPQWRLVGREFGPLVDGWLTLRSARAQPAGGVRLTLPLGGTTGLTAGAARATQTNEGWIRDDLRNSFGALLLGRDLRDYHETDAAWATLGRTPQPALDASGFSAAPFATLRLSRDRSLESRGPWSLVGRGEFERPNLPVDEITLVSMEVGAALGWQGQSARLRGQALIEHGREREGPLHFNHWLASGRWDMRALWNHSLDVSLHAVGTLGERVAPPQRWSFVGGLGTLPTLPVAALRGDRLVFIRSAYYIPVPVLELPLVGLPTVEFVHATGTAWRTGNDMPAWEQNLGVGLRVSALQVHAWIDPALERPRVTLLLDLGTP